MNTKEKAPGKFAGWVKTHKVAASCIAGALVIALAGGGVFAYTAITGNSITGVSAEETEYNTASEQWDAAKKDHAAALKAHDAALKMTEKSRKDGAENQAQVKAVITAATAAKLDVKALTEIDKKMTDALAEKFGITEGDAKDKHEVKTYAVPDSKPELVKGDDIDFVTFTGKLEDDIRQFKDATKNIEADTKKIEALNTALTGKQIDAAYLALAPAVVKHAEASKADVSKLSTAIKNKKVGAQDIIDAFNAIAAKTGEAPVVVPEPNPGTNPGNQDNSGNQNNNSGNQDNSGNQNNNSGNQDNSGNQNNNSGNQNNGNNQPQPPAPQPPVTQPPAPQPPVTQPEPPAPSGPIGDAHSELAGRYGGNNVNDDCYPANFGSSSSAAGLPPFMGKGLIGWDVWSEGSNWKVQYWSC